MIIVAGMPRSGTSVTMQTLFHLKWPIFGVAYPKYKNPEWQQGKPFWEHDEALGGNINFIKQTNMAVKIILHRGIRYTHLVPSRDKIILCEREFTALSKSQKLIGCMDEQNEKWYGLADEWIENTPFIKLKLEDTRMNPEKSVKTIRDFIGINTDMACAIDNIIRAK